MKLKTPKPGMFFYWTVGYLMAPTIDKALRKAARYLVKQSLRLAMKQNTSGQPVDASMSPDHSDQS